MRILIIMRKRGETLGGIFSFLFVVNILVYGVGVKILVAVAFDSPSETKQFTFMLARILYKFLCRLDHNLRMRKYIVTSVQEHRVLACQLMKCQKLAF